MDTCQEDLTDFTFSWQHQIFSQINQLHKNDMSANLFISFISNDSHQQICQTDAPLYTKLDRLTSFNIQEVVVKAVYEDSH